MRVSREQGCIGITKRVQASLLFILLFDRVVLGLWLCRKPVQNLTTPNPKALNPKDKRSKLRTQKD